MPLEETDEKLREAIDYQSLEGRAMLVRRAWRGTQPSDYDMRWHVEDIHDDFIIVARDGKFQRVGYTVDANFDVTFGQPEPVVIDVTYRAPTEGVSEAVRISGDLVMEAATPVDMELREANAPIGDDQGWIWEMTMIRPGSSKNGYHYRPEVLREAARLYEGAKAFDGHRSDTERASSPVSGMIGFWRNVKAATDGRLVGHLHVLRSSKQMRDLLVAAHDVGRPDLIGVSHDVYASGLQPVQEGGRTVRDVGKITGVSSVDTVAEASAGGQLERLVAGGTPPSKKEEGTMPPITDDSGKLSRDQILAALKEDQELAASVRESLTPSDDGKSDANKVTETKTDINDDTKIVETLEPGTFTHRLAIREAIDEHASKLPDDSRGKLAEAVKDFKGSYAELGARVKETVDMWAAVLGNEPGNLPGQTHMTVTEGTEKAQAALVATFMSGIPESELSEADKAAMTAGGERQRPFPSIKRAYSLVTGRREHSFDSGDFAQEILAASAGGIAPGMERLTESLTTASWTEVLGDSIRRRAIAEYQMPSRQSWRQVVSEISSVTDFRTNRRTRIGGYDVLPTVAEAGPYTSLTSPADEEATFSVAKKGGTEDFTWEMVRNDDMGGLRSIPINLGRAANLSVYLDVWNTFPTNAAIYDAVALFAVGHNNDAAAALSSAAMTAVRAAMRSQSRLGETSGALSIVPRFLVVPAELEETAFELTQSAQKVSANEDSTLPNLHRTMDAIVVPEYTDANDWYVVADPRQVPTIEVGFLDGRDEPEILIQDQPTVGSVFTNDTYTYKVRIVYGITVLDYRGLARRTQA